METTTYTARIIRPSEGKYLTQADPDTPITERVVTASEIWLAINDSEDNYVEITAEQAEAYLAEQAEAQEEVYLDVAVLAQAEPEEPEA